MWIVVVRDQSGKIVSKLPFTSGVVTIGRSKDRSIMLDSKAVSRFHGRLEVRNDQVVYVDEGSANGSMVDGKPVVAATPLSDLSLIEVGEFRLGILRTAPAGGRTERLSGVTVPEPPPARTMVGTPPSATSGIGELTPVAPPKPAVPVAAAAPKVAPQVFKSPIEGMSFKIPDAVPAAQAPKAHSDKLSDSMVGLLEQQLKGIQSQRSEVEQSARHRVETFEQSWKDAVKAARELQAKLRGNTKILYYVVARDEQEISVKVADNSRRGFTNLVLARRHPVTNAVQEGIVWFGEFGDEPKPYKEPREALEDFVRRIAGKLA